MSYVHITRVPGMSLADYRAVHEAIGDEPIEGQLAHAVGTAEGALQIVDLWTSKAEADRFAAERLFPAFARAQLHPPADTVFTTFDADVLQVAGKDQ